MKISISNNRILYFLILITFLLFISSSLSSQDYDVKVIEKLKNLKFCDVERIDLWSVSLEKKINLIKKDVASSQSREMLEGFVSRQPLDCYARINITNLLAANLYLNKQYTPALSLYLKLKTYRNLPPSLKRVIDHRIKDINSQLVANIPESKTRDDEALIIKEPSYDIEIILLKERIDVLDHKLNQITKDYSDFSERLNSTALKKDIHEISKKLDSLKKSPEKKDNLYLALVGIVVALLLYIFFIQRRFKTEQENVQKDEEDFLSGEQYSSINDLSVILQDQINDSKVKISEVLDDFVIAYTDSLINNYEISQKDLPSIRSRLFKELFNQDYENLISNSDKTSEPWKEGALKGLSDSKNILDGKLAHSLKEYLIQKS